MFHPSLQRYGIKLLCPMWIYISILGTSKQLTHNMIEIPKSQSNLEFPIYCLVSSLPVGYRTWIVLPCNPMKTTSVGNNIDYQRLKLTFVCSINLLRFDLNMIHQVQKLFSRGVVITIQVTCGILNTAQVPASCYMNCHGELSSQ